MNARWLLIPTLLLSAAAGAEIAADTPPLDDPTRPSGNALTPAADAAGGAAEPLQYVLSATQITPGKRLAIINGTQVAEGEQLGAARVLKISHAQVNLALQGDIVTLQLLQAKVKQPR